MARTKHSLKRSGVKRTVAKRTAPRVVVPKSEDEVRKRAPKGQSKKAQKEAYKATLDQAKANASVGDYYTTIRNDVPRYHVLLVSRTKDDGEEMKWKMIPEGSTPRDAITARTIPAPTREDEEAYGDRVTTKHFGRELLSNDSEPVASFNLARRSDGEGYHYYWKKIRTKEEKETHEPKATSQAQQDRSAVLALISSTLNDDEVYIPIQNQSKVASAIASSVHTGKRTPEVWGKVLAAIRKNPDLIIENTPDEYLACRGTSYGNRVSRAKASKADEVIEFVNRPPELEIVSGEGRAKAPAKKASSKASSKAPSNSSSPAKKSPPKKAAAKRSVAKATSALVTKNATKKNVKVDVRLEDAAERLEEAVGAAVIAAADLEVKSKGNKVEIKTKTPSPKASITVSPSKAKTPSPAKASSPKKSPPKAAPSTSIKDRINRAQMLAKNAPK